MVKCKCNREGCPNHIAIDSESELPTLYARGTVNNVLIFLTPETAQQLIDQLKPIAEHDPQTAEQLTNTGALA